MEWLAQLQGQVVGLDSAPLIYFIEENPTYLEMTDAFFEAMVRGEFRVVTSVVTLLEVLVQFGKDGRDNEALLRSADRIHRHSNLIALQSLSIRRTSSDL
jgi:hypothetical protein